MLKWFSLSGIYTEVKRIRWPKKDEVGRSFLIVLAFVFFFGIFFVISEAATAAFLRLIGVGA
jgi:preprotein translocase subunit SecE